LPVIYTLPFHRPGGDLVVEFTYISTHVVVSSIPALGEVYSITTWIKSFRDLPPIILTTTIFKKWRVTTKVLNFTTKIVERNKSGG
jgi:hypothetical protein